MMHGRNEDMASRFTLALGGPSSLRAKTARSAVWQMTILLLSFATLASLAVNSLYGAEDTVPSGGTGLARNTPLYPLLSRRPPEEVRKLYDKIGQAEDAANIFESLNRFDRAKARWQDIRDLTQKEMPEATWLIAEAERQIGRMERAERSTDAEKKTRQEIDSLHGEAARLLSNRRFSEANAIMDKAVALAASHWGVKSEDHIQSIEHATRAAFLLGDYSRAEELARRVLAYREDLQGHDNPRLVPVLLFLTEISRERCNIKAMERYAERGNVLNNAHLAILGKGREPRLPWLDTLAEARSDVGDFAGARRLRKEAFDILKQNEQKPSGYYIYLRIQNGRIDIADGYYLGGLRQAQEIASLITRATYLDPTELIQRKAQVAYLEAMGLLSVGLLRAADEKLTETMQALDRTATSVEKTIVQANVLFDHGLFLTYLGFYDDAERAFDQSDANLVEAFPVGNWRMATNKSYRGFLESRKGNHVRAIKMWEEAFAERKEALRDLPMSYARTQILLANVQNAGGQTGKAEATLLECLAIREKNLREGHPDRGEVFYELGAVYLTQKKYAQAEKSLAQAEAIYRKAVGERWPVYHNVLRRQIELYQAMNRQADATKIEARLKTLEAKYPPPKDEENLEASILSALSETGTSVVPEPAPR